MSIEDYEPVASRLARFWEKHPEGRVITKLLTFEGDRVIVQADIYVDREDDRPVATDFAEEIRGSNNVNKTSHIENAATSAIGRALADCDFASSTDWTKRPSREEMQKVERMTSRPTEGGTITEPSNLRFRESVVPSTLLGSNWMSRSLALIVFIDHVKDLFHVGQDGSIPHACYRCVSQSVNTGHI